MNNIPSVAEYEALGREYKDIEARLINLNKRLAELTGTSKKPYKELTLSIQAFDKSKSAADNLFFEHYPGLTEEFNKVFY